MIKDLLLDGTGSTFVKEEVVITVGIHDKSINERVAFVEKRDKAKSALMRRHWDLPTASEHLQLMGMVAASQSTIKLSENVTSTYSVHKFWEIIPNIP